MLKGAEHIDPRWLRRRDDRRSDVRMVSALGLSALTLATVLTACSSSGSTSKSSSSVGGSSTSSSAPTDSGVAQARAGLVPFENVPTTIPQTQPLAKRPPSGKVVFVGQPNVQNGQVRDAFTKAAQAFGWTVTTVSYDPANPATFDTALTSALAMHPLFVASSGTLPSQISASVLSAYKAAMVPIDIDGADPCTVAPPIIGCTDGHEQQYAAGKLFADWFISDSGGKGKAIQQSSPGYPILNAANQGFSDEVNKLCPACAVKTVPVTLQQIGSGSVPDVMTSAARANPTYKYLLFNDAIFADGIVAKLRAAGLSGLTIGGGSLDPTSAQALRDGTEAAWVALSTKWHGYALIDAAARYLTGSSGEVLDQTTVPKQLLTKANIGNTTEWDEPANALDLLTTLWKSGS
jgi:ribose transport system substrate-binding protein